MYSSPGPFIYRLGWLEGSEDGSGTCIYEIERKKKEKIHSLLVIVYVVVQV